MAKRFKFTGAYRPHFLRQWRIYRGLNLDEMVLAIAELAEVNGGLSKASLSRIETGKTPYSRDTLEAYASVLSCDPADLLMQLEHATRPRHRRRRLARRRRTNGAMRHKTAASSSAD